MVSEAVDERHGALATIDALDGQATPADLERALPSLRREAFAELDRAPGFPTWPVTTDEPGPPPGGRGLPEVDVTELDAGVLRRSINQHGCLLVRGVADPADIERLTEGIDRAFDGSDARRRAAQDQGAPLPPASPWYSRLKVPGNKGWGPGRVWVEDGAGVMLADSPRLLAQLFELYERKGVRGVVAGYLGERPVLSAKKGTLRRVPPDSDSHWHQDGSFLGDGLRVLNIWLTLTRCGDDAPGLDIVPKRFDRVVATGSGDARFANMVGDDVIAEVSADAPVIRPVFEPGEALLFDELFLHSTAAAPTMTRRRYAIESWFFAPSAYPDPDVQVPLVW
ncbi:MAG: hypothetical protein JO291_05415 [Acidimicrobiia bacterium]|nr:hypothetical protein [Acidimicrobiia bacterium]